MNLQDGPAPETAVPPRAKRMRPYFCAGLTALHYAAFKGNLAMVRLLLEAGAPVNVADDRGRTPLMDGGELQE
jgi:hypothetical protein